MHAYGFLSKALKYRLQPSLIAFTLTALSAGCLQPEGDLAGACTHDDDCSGERLCVAQLCTDPQEVSACGNEYTTEFSLEDGQPECGGWEPMDERWSCAAASSSALLEYEDINPGCLPDCTSRAVVGPRLSLAECGALGIQLRHRFNPDGLGFPYAQLVLVGADDDFTVDGLVLLDMDGKEVSHDGFVDTELQVTAAEWLEAGLQEEARLVLRAAPKDGSVVAGVLQWEVASVTVQAR